MNYLDAEGTGGGSTLLVSCLLDVFGIFRATFKTGELEMC